MVDRTHTETDLCPNRWVCVQRFKWSIWWYFWLWRHWDRADKWGHLVGNCERSGLGWLMGLGLLRYWEGRVKQSVGVDHKIQSCDVWTLGEGLLLVDLHLSRVFKLCGHYRCDSWERAGLARRRSIFRRRDVRYGWHRFLGVCFAHRLGWPGLRLYDTENLFCRSRNEAREPKARGDVRGNWNRLSGDLRFW
jgi:hypothetical protein